MSQFSEGYALLIGVGADLPVTVKDACAVAKILRDAERCAYPEGQVRLLVDGEASRGGILGALDELAERTTSASTVVFYFSGHGYEVDGGFGKQYFLIPNDCTPDLVNSAIGGKEFMQKLAAIPAQKMLVLLDCCHAGGMDNEKGAGGPKIAKAPLPAEAEEILAQGRGRVFIASSRADEKSLTGTPYSEFTNALVAAFAGAGVSEKDGYVRAADLAMYAREMVPKFTGERQHPVLHFEQADNFAVAYYAAGETEPKGLPEGMVRKTDRKNDETNLSSDMVQGGSSAVAQGERSVAAGRDMTGNTIVTGGTNEIDQSSSVFNQKGQTVHGSQTNIGGNVDTGGGLFNTGTMNTGGGDFVERSQVRSGLDPAQLAQVINPLMGAAVESASIEHKGAAAEKVTAIQEEAKKGDEADDSVLATLVEELVALVPNAVTAVVSAFGTPLLGGIAGPITKHILKRWNLSEE